MKKLINLLLIVDGWIAKYILRRKYFVSCDPAANGKDKSVWCVGYVDRHGKTKIRYIQEL